MRGMNERKRTDPRRGFPLFSTIHGSHLYGLAHACSDDDRFVVTDSRSPVMRQQVQPDGIDTAAVGLDLFLLRVADGSHQSVEALFSPFKEWSIIGLDYRPMIESMRVGGATAFAAYERTITKFCYGDFKKRRHAARLSLNLAGLRERGRFTPVMTVAEVEWATRLAIACEGDSLREVLLPR